MENDLAIDSCLRIDKRAAVTSITLNRPERLNALSLPLLEQLHQALREAAVDESCRCVLLTGAGRAFSSGADLQDLVGALKPGERPDLGAALESHYHPVIRALRELQKPVVAAVNGTAAGAGLNIALACDLVMAARSARLIQSFVNIGLVPDAGGSWIIPRLIGRARAARWLMSGEALGADQACDWGLIAEVVDDSDLHAAAATRAEALARQPTLALAAIKTLIDASSENDLQAQLALEASTQTRVGYSEDALEGVTAFVQKRPPRFQGR